MFFISLPLSVKVGDTVECKINGEPKKVSYRDARTLVIEPDDARTIIETTDGGTLRNFFCGDSEKDDGTDGTEGITIIRP